MSLDAPAVRIRKRLLGSVLIHPVIISFGTLGDEIIIVFLILVVLGRDLLRSLGPIDNLAPGSATSINDVVQIDGIQIVVVVGRVVIVSVCVVLLASLRLVKFMLPSMSSYHHRRSVPVVSRSREGKACLGKAVTYVVVVIIIVIVHVIVHRLLSGRRSLAFALGTERGVLSCRGAVSGLGGVLARSSSSVCARHCASMSVWGGYRVGRTRRQVSEVELA
jgi:hypothetical protein